MKIKIIVLYLLVLINSSTLIYLLILTMIEGLRIMNRVLT